MRWPNLSVDDMGGGWVIILEHGNSETRGRNPKSTTAGNTIASSDSRLMFREVPSSRFTMSRMRGTVCCNT